MSHAPACSAFAALVVLSMTRRRPSPNLLERARALHRQVPLDRRAQRLSVGASRARSGARPRQARHPRQPAVDHDRHPAPQGGRRRRAVLVGLRAGRRCRDRPRSPPRSNRSTSSIAWCGSIRTRSSSRSPPRDVERIHKAGQDCVADRHGGRPLDRQLARQPADVPSPRRALHDDHALEQHRVGRRRDRHAEEQRPVAVRRRGRPGDELARDARGSEPRLARHDGRRAARRRRRR